MSRSTGLQAAKFTVIGGVGFLVDGGIMTLLNSIYELDLLPARLCSFSVAVTVTWILNRRQTFTDRASNRLASEWGRYAAINSVGAMMNIGIFFWLIDRYTLLREVPLLPLAAASLVVLVFNFFASKHIAFKRQKI